MPALSSLQGVLQTGTHAARPAATAVGAGALYACSDHSLVYQSDGSAWSTWATLGGGDAADIAIADAGGYYTGTDTEAALQEAAAATAAHLADASDAHDAAAVSITDTGGYFTGTDVEAALQELGAGGGGGGGGGTPAESAAARVYAYSTFR